jgi:hypothetical protein
MEIRETDWGIANHLGEYIEVNRHLKTDCPELYDEIVKHELAHTEEKGFNKKDFVLDMTGVNNLSLMRFMFKHPKSLVQFSPIIKAQGKFYYDINLIIIYAVMLFIAFATIYFLI